MTQYVADVLQKPTTTLDVPDLQAIAKDHDLTASLILCRLLIVIGVQCEKNKEFIDKIRGLNETDQHYVMKAIEQVCGHQSNGGGPYHGLRSWRKSLSLQVVKTHQSPA